MTLRILSTGAARGSWNMAVDEALLVRANDAGQMTLRFYQWEPATVSLGYFQQQESRQTHAASGACPLVRRATGGGAIVHDRELTYSLVLPSGNRWARSNQQVYDLVHEILVRSLSDWQIEASLVPEKSTAGPSLFCVSNDGLLVMWLWISKKFAAAPNGESTRQYCSTAASCWSVRRRRPSCRA